MPCISLTIVFPTARSLAALVFLMLALGGCDKKKDAPAPPPSAGGEAPATAPAGNEHDLANNPAAVLDPNLTAAEMAYHGVRLGDSQSDIPAIGLSGEPDLSGWVGFKGQPNTFRLNDGKVAAISIKDDALLSRLNITSEQDLLAKLGETQDKIGDARRVQYRYKNRNIALWLDAQSGKVLEVILGD